MKAIYAIQLILINLLYACVSVCTKAASGGEFMSWQYVGGIVGAVALLGVYAIWWQQLLKRIPLATAYMFKGTSIVFVLLLSVLLFGESITWFNIAGAILIIIGIILYSQDDNKKSNNNVQQPQAIQSSEA